MATYHLKSTGAFGGDVYFVNGNHWTDDFSKRKTWTNKASATSAKNKKVEKNGVKYNPTKLANSVVVTE